MTHVNFERIREIVLGAIGRPMEERASFLDAACGDDVDLRREVESLLAHDTNDVAFQLLEDHPLEHTSQDEAADDDATFAAAGREAPPGHIGPYRVLERLGSGGMGEVYLAEQTEPIARQVALKVIKLGLDTREVISRFKSERQALAMMNHPNIASIFDAGSTDDGRPYFAMEHVPGEAITTYCDRHDLPLRKRLELIRDVCLAIHHAHQKGIIHRDIKSSNVLVTVQDGHPVPKVIDFGVAKAIEHGLGRQSLHTQQGRVLGTPAYMSPEQAEMTGLNVDTTSDIYSLGVLMYEILTGTLPFPPEKLLSAGLAEMHRIIRDETPPRPSVRISSYGQEAAEQARHRGIEVRAWARQVRGELEWITMRAMEKDRTRRYQSATAMAEDIERHLRGDAVLAGPPSVTYQLRKFVRRYRVAVAFVVTVVILALGFGVAMGVLREAAEHSRAEAEARTEELEQVTAFQGAMLLDVDIADMGSSLTRELCDRVRGSLLDSGRSPTEVDTVLARFTELLGLANTTDIAVGLLDEHLLRRAVATIDDDFADQPMVRAQLGQTLARIYEYLGKYESAYELQKTALSNMREAHGENHPETLAAIGLLTSVLLEMDRFEEALQPSRQYLATSRQLLGDDHSTTLTAMNNLGVILKRLGRHEEALTYYRESLARRRISYGEEHPATLSALNNLAVLFKAMGRYEEALPLYREALALQQRVAGADSHNALAMLNNLGNVLQALGRSEEALATLREAVAQARRMYGDDHPETLIFLTSMALALSGLDHHDEALAAIGEVVSYRRRTLGDQAVMTLVAVHVEGAIRLGMGDLAGAETCLREALAGRRAALGEDHPRTLASLLLLARVLLKKGDAAAAVKELEVVEARLPALSGKPIVEVGLALVELGRARAATGAFASGQQALEEATRSMTPVTGGSPAQSLLKRVLRAQVELHEAWHAAQPAGGHDLDAAMWQARLDSLLAARPASGA